MILKGSAMWRWAFAAALVCIALYVGPAFSDQFRVVAVKSADIKLYNDVIKAYRDECDCTVEELTISGHTNGIVSTVLKSAPDAVLAVGTDALRQVRSIEHVPVVYALINTAVEYGLTGTNISGVSMEISPERYMETIRTVFPWAKQIGVIYDPENSGRFVENITRLGKSDKLSITAHKVNKPNQVPAMLGSMKDIDLLLMLPDTSVLNSANINSIFLFSFENKIPVITFSRKFVEMGSAAGLLIEPKRTGQQAAGITLRLLKKVAPRPIREYSEMRTLLINMKILKKMGITIQDGALEHAETID